MQQTILINFVILTIEDTIITTNNQLKFFPQVKKLTDKWGIEIVPVVIPAATNNIETRIIVNCTE